MIPCCCYDCTIASDNFDRADSGTVSGWTENSGTWDIASNKLACTSSSAVATNDSSAWGPPSGSYGALGFHLTADVTCASTSDAARLIAEYTDSNNYWFAEVQPGATNGTLKIFQRGAGVNTQRGRTVPVPGFSAGDTVTLEFCMHDDNDGDRVWARVGDNRTAYAASGLGGTGKKCGAGTGGSSTDVKFDNWVLSRHTQDNPACLNCGTYCHGGADVGQQIQLDFAGFSNGGGCTNCSSLNTSFVVDALCGQGLLSNEADGARWTYSFTNLGCTTLSSGTIILSLFVISEVYYIRVRIATVGATYAEFSLNMGSTAEPDFTALSATDIPLFATGSLCNSASATCTATYLG